MGNNKIQGFQIGHYYKHTGNLAVDRRAFKCVAINSQGLPFFEGHVTFATPAARSTMTKCTSEGKALSDLEDSRDVPSELETAKAALAAALEEAETQKTKAISEGLVRLTTDARCESLVEEVQHQRVRFEELAAANEHRSNMNAQLLTTNKELAAENDKQREEIGGFELQTRLLQEDLAKARPPQPPKMWCRSTGRGPFFIIKDIDECRIRVFGGKYHHLDGDQITHVFNKGTLITTQPERYMALKAWLWGLLTLFTLAAMVTVPCALGYMLERTL